MNFEDIIINDKETKDQFQNLASLNYSIEQIAKYFNLNIDEFKFEFNSSLILRELFDSAILKVKTDIVIASLNSAKAGNVTQSQRFDKIIADIEFQKMKNIIIYGQED